MPEAAYYVNENKEVKPSFIEHITLVDANKKRYNFKVVFDAETYQIITCSAETESAASRVSAGGSDADGEKHQFYVTEENGVYTMEDTDKNIKVYNVNGNTLSPSSAIVDGDGNVYNIEKSPVFEKVIKIFPIRR